MIGAADRPALIRDGQRLAFFVVASLFFAWALANSLNDVLVRHFQKALELSRAEAGLIQSAFYLGYFVAALPAAALMRRRGYKAGILAGLGLYAAGALLFWPAAEARAFPMFLGALAVIALGLACLETAANPYIAAFGDPRTGPARLNLAQAFNGLGAVVGPLVGGLFILSGADLDAAAGMSAAQEAAYRAAEARAVQGPYLGLALFVLLLALLVAAVRLPEVGGDDDRGRLDVAGTLRRPGVAGAVAAQFFYVAAQVCVWSYFIDFAKEAVPAASEKAVAALLSSSIALLMIGRFAGAAIMRRTAPDRLLAAYAAAATALCAVATVADGWAAVAALWATSFFMSIMFPTIFALGVQGLGPATKTASSLLIMSIVGGAVVPPVMGWIADRAGAIQPSLVVPLVCFVVVAWFGAVRVGVLGRGADRPVAAGAAARGGPDPEKEI